MVRLKIAWGLIFLIGQTPLAMANQISMGIISKNDNTIIYNNTHNNTYKEITLTYYITQNVPDSSNPTITPERLINDLGKRNDRLSREISKLIEKGDFDKAQIKIDYELRGLSGVAQNLAFYYYILGGVYLVQQKYLLAERSLTTASSLAPNNCKYRGLFATTLIVLDRYAEASRIAGENVSEVKACLRDGDILDRSRILLVQTHIAIENRDEAGTENLIYEFESLISHISDDKAYRVKLNEGAIFACTMESLIQSVWKHNLLKQTIFRSSELCNKLSEDSPGKGIPTRRLISTKIINESLGRLGGLNTFDLHRRDPSANIKAITDQIDLVKESPNFEELGFDEVQRSTKLGRLFFTRGQARTVSFNFEAAAEDYRSSYAKLEPLALLKYPEALDIYARIILLHSLYEYSSWLHEVSFPSILDTPEKTFYRMIKGVVHAKDYDETPQTCLAIAMVSFAADFESHHQWLKVISTDKESINSYPDLESLPQHLRSGQASLVSNEDKKNIKAKLSSCMKVGIGRKSLLYDELNLLLQGAAYFGSSLDLALSQGDKRLSEFDTNTMQAMEELDTKIIDAHERLIGFPKYYESREVFRNVLSSRARWRERQANYDDARSDLERKVDLSKRFGSKVEVMQALGLLSSLVMRHFNEPYVTASQAQEAFINGFEYISGEESQYCKIVVRVSQAGNRAARRWLNVGRWDKAVIAMRQIVEIGEAQAPACRSMNIGKTSDDKRIIEYTQDAKQALEIIGENSSDYVGRNLPIDSELIKKYSDETEIGNFKVWDKLLASNSNGDGADIYYPLIETLKEIADTQAGSRNIFRKLRFLFSTEDSQRH